MTTTSEEVSKQVSISAPLIYLGSPAIQPLHVPRLAEEPTPGILEPSSQCFVVNRSIVMDRTSSPPSGAASSCVGGSGAASPCRCGGLSAPYRGIPAEPSSAPRELISTIPEGDRPATAAARHARSRGKLSRASHRLRGGPSEPSRHHGKCITLTAVGSLGDLYPYLAIGGGLKREGMRRSSRPASATREMSSVRGLASDL